MLEDVNKPGPGAELYLEAKSQAISYSATPSLQALNAGLGRAIENFSSPTTHLTASPHLSSLRRDSPRKAYP